LLATCRKTGEIRTRATLARRLDDQFGLWLSLVERLVRDERRRNMLIFADVLSPAFS